MPRLLPLVLLLSLAAGCNPFAPELEEGDPFGDLLGDPKTVDGFFTNFQNAYELRDVSLYEPLLDSAFVFIYHTRWHEHLKGGLYALLILLALVFSRLFTKDEIADMANYFDVVGMGVVLALFAIAIGRIGRRGTVEEQTTAEATAPPSEEP